MSHLKTTRLRRCALGAAGASVLLLAGGASAKAATTEVVRAADVAAPNADAPFPGSFRYGQADTRKGTVVGFQFGPADPPLGKGSYSISTSASGPKGQLMSKTPAGYKLSELSALSYSTYRKSSSTAESRQVPAINIVIDFNGPAQTGGYDTLIYEPVYQAGGANVVEDTWQSRDAYAGGEALYWTSKPINNQPAGAAPANFRSLSQITEANPDATIYFAGINQGSGNDGLDANVDALRIATGADNDVTADLEPDNALDSYKKANTGDQPTLTASGPLDAGRAYTVTVRGTSSTFAPALMAVKPTKGWAICGKPEDNVFLSSPMTTNGRAGADAEYLFGFPQKGAKCAKSNESQLPKAQSGLRFNLDGSTFVKLVANERGKNVDHTYTYSVVGAGQPLRVRFPDSNYKDNYGRYVVDVTAVPTSTDDEEPTPDEGGEDDPGTPTS